jgi:hypothetical protein
VLSIWGADFEAVGKMFDMMAVWTEMAEDLPAEKIGQCGHLHHEEQPEKVSGLLLEFLEAGADEDGTFAVISNAAEIADFVKFAAPVRGRRRTTLLDADETACAPTIAIINVECLGRHQL